MNKYILSYTLSLLFCVSSGAADGYERWKRRLPPLEPQPVTLDLADDYSPAFSRDGKRLIFASNRRGNYDIWELGLRSRKLRQLTDHRAIDRRPAFYPGKRLYYISTRQDATGDVYSLKTHSTLFMMMKPLLWWIDKRVTQGWTGDEGEELEVAASPDGKHIAYVTRRHGVKPVTYFHNTRNGEERPVARPGACNPCFSPDGRALVFDVPNASGGSDIVIEDLAMGGSAVLVSGTELSLDPSFSRDGEKVYYLRYGSDTSGDGKTDLLDKPSICVYDMRLGRSLRLAPPRWNIFELACGPDGRLYFVSDHAGNKDIWVLGPQGAVPDADSALHQLRYALETRQEDLKEIALRKVLWNFPRDRHAGAQALFALARVLRGAGEKEGAARIYRELARSYRYETAAGLAAIELLLMEKGQRGAEFRKRLRLIGEEHREHDEVAARVLLELGGSFETGGRLTRAQEAYAEISERYPDVAGSSADAWRRRGAMHEAAARHEQARRCYLEAAQGKNASAETAEQAQYRLLVLESGLESGLPSLAGCERVARLYPQLIYLQAQAQLTVGEIYEKLGDKEQAVKEYGRLVSDFPQVARLAGEASLRAARLSAESGREQERIWFLEKAVDFCRDQERAEEIRDTLFSIYLARADTHREAREHIDAIKDYRGAVRQRPRQAGTYRKMISCYEAVGKMREIIGEYEEMVDEHAGDDLYHYLLGYCYSSPVFKPPYYGRAIKQLKRALEINPSQTYAYLTLGWVYDRLAAKKKRKRHRLVRWPVKLVKLPVSMIYSVLEARNLAPPRADDIDPEDWRLRAIELYMTGLAENEAATDPELEAYFLVNIANQYVQLDNLDAAYDYYRARQEYDVPFDNAGQKALFDYNAGRACRKVEEYGPAMRHYRSALEHYREQGEGGYVFDLYNLMGNVAWERGEHGDVIEYSRLALAESKKLKLRGEESRLHRNIAGAHHYRGEEREAIKHARLALDAAARIQGGGLGLSEFAVGLTEEMSEAYRGFDETHTRKLLFTWIGEGYANLRDYEEAINYFKKKLALYRSKGEGANVYAIILNNIGVFYYYLGRYDLALDSFDRSLEICRELDVAEGLLVNEVDRAVVAATMAYYADANQGWWGRVGKVEISRSLEACYRARVEMARRDEGERVAFLSNLIGSLHIYRAARLGAALGTAAATLSYFDSRRGELELALDAFDAALEYACEREDKQAVVHLNLANVHLELGDWESAERSLEQARALCVANYLYNLWWRVERSTGRYYKLRGEKKKAIYHYQLALEKVELMPRMLTGQKIKNFLANDELFVYEDIMLFLIEAGEIEESFDYFERCRDKRVVDLVADYDISFYRQEDGKFFRDIRASQRRIAAKREELLNLKQDPFVRREVVEKKARELKGEERRYEDFLLDVYNVRRDLSALFTIHPDITADVQYLLSRKEAVLAYHATQDHLIAWCIDREQVKAKLLPLPKQEMRRAVSDYLAAVRRKDCPPEKSREMYELLLAPFRTELAGVELLIIIPDDYLFYLPWASLHDGEKYLVERAKLLFAPSFTYVDRCYMKRNLNRINLLGVAEKGGAAELKAAERQVEGRATLMTGEMPEGDFKEALSSSGVYHIGTGFHFYASDPFKSYIALSRQGEEDGKFRLNEFFAQEMRGNLMVLARSDFPEQELGAGNEFFTLVSALTFAGTPSLVYSLWEMEGMARKRLLADFYERQKDEDFLDALRGAQLAMLKRKPQPCYWAGFQLCGFTGMDKKRSLKFAKKEVKRAGAKAVELAAQKELKKSLYYFQLQAELAEKVRDIKMMVQGLQGVVNLGNKLGDFEAAVSAQLELNKLYAGSGQANLVYLGGDNLAFLYQRAGMLEQAEEQYLKNIETLGEGNLGEELKIYRALVAVGQEMGESETTISYQAKAIALARRAGDEALEAELLIDRAQLQLGEEDYTGAIGSAQEAIGYFSGAQGSERELARAYIRLGVAYTGISDYDRALAACAKAVRAAVAVAEPRLEAEARLKAANVSLLGGDYQAARQQGQASLKLALETGNRVLELQNYNLEGLFYLSLNEAEKALVSFRAALKVAEDIGSRREQATVHNNIGLVFRVQEEDEQALLSFRHALVLDEELGLKGGQGHDHRNIGVSLEKMGRLQEAYAGQERALELAAEAGDRRLEARCAAGLGSLDFKLGRSKQAEKGYRRALKVAEEAGLAEERWQILRGLGKVLEKRGKLEEALLSLKAAVEIVEGMRAKLKVEEFKTGFLANKLDLYQDLIDLSLRAGRDEEALDYLERAKSRNFLDLLGNRKIRLKDSASRELLEEERELRNRMEALTLQVSRAGAEQRQAIEGELEKLRGEYGALMLKIKEGNPELSAMVSVDPATTAQIRALMDGETAFLEYFLEKDRILIFVVRKEGTVCKAVEFDRDAFREEVRAYRGGMEKMEPVEARQALFYDYLVAPVREHLDGVRTLGVVPHDVLHYLSLAPIGASAEEQLIDRYELFYAPSLNVFKFCLEKVPGGRGVLAMGNPDLGNPLFDLPYAALEIESIAMTEQVEPYLGKKASEERLKRKASGFRRLHFACHGEFDAKNPLFSGLLMAPSSSEDGRLEAHEIFELELGADLVTLSACQTGLGKLLSGDEIIGLNRAFITAGASAVVSSLWRVNDLTTALMIKRFYRYLPQEENKAAALRRAQLDVRKRYPHPGYWAAFRLTGYYK